MIRKNYGINPKLLNDKEWVEYYREHLYLEKIKLENLEGVITSALIKGLDKFFNTK